MADVKIGVDADDAVRNIEQLQSVFDRFAAASEKQTATWEAVHGAVGGLAGSVTDLHTTMVDVAALMGRLVDNQEKLDHGTERASRRWQQLARHTRDAAGHIRSATDSLLKWAGISGLVAGAAGFGAQHLIFDFASGVSARRSAAMGLNTTYGGLASARTNYARFGDADGVLGNIASAQNDPSKRLAFANLGISNFADRDSADLLSDVLKRTKDRLDDAQARGQPLAQTARNLHLDEIFLMGDLQRIQRDGKEEVYGQADRIGRDRRGLDLAPDVQRKWQELATQLAKAGTAIETVLVNRLVALEPGLQKLSESFTKVAQTLLAKDGPAAQWLGEVNVGLEWLAKKLGDPETQKGLGEFVTTVGHAAAYVFEMSKKALALLHWLAKLTGEDVSTVSSSEYGTGAGGTGGLTTGGGINLRGSGDGRDDRRFNYDRKRGSLSPQRPMFGHHGKTESTTPYNPSGPADVFSPDSKDMSSRANLDSKDVRNKNPMSVGWAEWEREFGGFKSRDTDTGHNMATFPTWTAGYKANQSLLLRKYNSGLRTMNQIITTPHVGWTPGNTAAVRNMSRASGIDPNADLKLDTPEGMRRFSYVLMNQEMGRAEADHARNMLRKEGTEIAPAKPAAAKPVATAPVKVTVTRATGANPTPAIAAGAAAQ